MLPGFRSYTTDLYERLVGVGRMILEALALGLGLDADEREALMALDSPRNSQLRLLHYPGLTRERVRNEVFARLPAHTDWVRYLRR